MVYGKLLSIPHQRRNYFLYLAIKSGLGIFSATKRREWSNFLLSRKVDVVMQGQRNSLIYFAVLDLRMTEQDAVITTLSKGPGMIDIATGFQIEQNLIARQHEFADLQDEKLEAIKNELIVRQNTQIQEMKGALTELGGEFHSLRDLQETQAVEWLEVRQEFAATVDSTMTHHSELMLSRMEQLISASHRPPLDGPGESAGPRESAVPRESAGPDRQPPMQPTVQLYLRIRNPTAEAEHIIDTTTLSIHRSFLAGEPTDVVARAITRGISASVPFVFGLVGYSGGGKTYTFDGLLDTILRYLPEVEVTVLEVLATRKFLKSFTNAQGLGEQISKLRQQRPIPANAASSRSHLVVTFESVSSERKYGMLLDIAGDEQSIDRAMLAPGEVLVSSEIARNNTDFRALIQAMISGLDVSGVDARMFKRSSKLNSELSAFLGCHQHTLIRLLYCADGSKGDMVAKTIKLMPEM